jgi:hypothetical protein
MLMGMSTQVSTGSSGIARVLLGIAYVTALVITFLGLVLYTAVTL